MIPFGALTGPLPKAGVIVAAALVAIALLQPRRRPQSAAMLAALLLAPALLLADIWRSPQLGIVHHHPLVAAAIAVAGLALIAVMAVLIARRPWLFAALVVATLPFRIPIQAGGTTSNLLVPLYLVVAAGSLSFIVRGLRGNHTTVDRSDAAPRAGWLERLLAIYVLLYALQSVYSDSFEKASQQMVFFYIPFALMFVLLGEIEWTPWLVRLCLGLVVGLAVLFAAVGFVEYATKTIILNPKLVVQNDLHAYFTVNSVFFDPDIFGRFLALVMILLAAVLLYSRRRRDQLGATGLLAILWVALVLTLSRSSLGALLVGLGILAALRWTISRTLLVAVSVIALGAAAVAASPKTFGLNQGLNGVSSGRASLVSGGIDLFADRPVWGFGSASFVAQYRAHHPQSSQTLAASHTIPITVAAEQGLIGEAAYVALVLVACVTLVSGARADPARAAVAAAFLALILHTLLYADFLEDPVTWTLLGAGVALAHRPRSAADAVARPSEELAAVPV